MKKVLLFLVFLLPMFFISFYYSANAQSTNWADYGLTEDTVKYLSEKEKQDILNSRTPVQTIEDLKEKDNQSPQNIALNSDVVSCFDYYKFGSIDADISAPNSSVVAGTNINFSGNIKNNNEYPIVQGTLYIKIFKNVGGEKNPNGPDVVDQFVALDNITIPANGSVPAKFTWKVPAYATTGNYKMATYFVSDKKFNLLGLSFTDDIIGNSFNFTVSGEKVGVAFDKSSVIINKNPYFFATYPARIAKENDANVSIKIDNTTDQIQKASINWKLYSWDSMNPNNLVRDFKEDILISPNASQDINVLIKEKDAAVYYLVGELSYRDSKSIVGIRLVREGVDKVRLNFPSVTSYPLKSGEQSTVFTCLHNSGQSSQVPNNKVVLEVLDEGGKVVESYIYKGIVTGEMMAVKKDFVPKTNMDVFSVRASLYTNDSLVDESIMKYDCKLIDPSKCSDNKSKNLIYIVLGIIALVIIVLAVVKKKRELVAPVAVFLLAVSSFIPHVTEAKSVQWNKVENETLLYFWNNNNASTTIFGKTLTSTGWAKGLANPNVTVKYNVEVRNPNTGELLSENASVPVGTKLSLKLIKHEYSDIDWFGTGYSTDSPYGEWGSSTVPPTVACNEKDYLTTTAWKDKKGTVRVYIPLVLSYPNKTITTNNNLTCDPLSGNESTGYTKNCTVTGPGAIDTTFNIGATTGKFYYRYYGYDDGGLLSCAGTNVGMEKPSGAETVKTYQNNNADYFKHTSNPYTLDVPAQTISYNLIATQIPVGNRPPTVPTITGTSTGVISTSLSYSVMSTDPDNDQIRYNFDWDSNGSIDAYSPSVSYVNSGTTKTESKSWSSTGSKTFKVQAEDSRGATSTWATKDVMVSDSSTILTPITLSVTPSCGSVGLIWNNNGATSYQVFRKDREGYSSVSPVLTTTSFTDSAVTNSTTYIYKIWSSNGTTEVSSGGIAATPVCICSTTQPEICTRGTLSDLPDTTTDYKWECTVSGVTTSCSLPKNSCDTTHIDGSTEEVGGVCTLWTCVGNTWSGTSCLDPNAIFKILPRTYPNCLANINTKDFDSCILYKGATQVGGPLASSTIPITSMLPSSGTYKLQCTKSTGERSDFYDKCISNPNIIEE